MPLIRRHGCRAGLHALVAGLVLLLAAPAVALVRVPAHPSAVSGNPADAFVDLAIEGSNYDKATRCSKAKRPGMVAFQRWLERQARGASWGTYRCEKWGKGSASLHAEGRAIDWHLDRSKPADRREAKRLILLLLAPDRAGNAQALARRMGVAEIIWDCGYWQAGMPSFKKYGACYSKAGRLKKKVDATQAHRNHVHFGLTKSGAAKKTSFWTRRAARPQDQGAEPDTGEDDSFEDDFADDEFDPDDDPALSDDDPTNDPEEAPPDPEAGASDEDAPF